MKKYIYVTLIGIAAAISLMLTILALVADMIANVTAYPIICLITNKWYGGGYTEDDPFTSGIMSTKMVKLTEYLIQTAHGFLS